MEGTVELTNAILVKLLLLAAVAAFLYRRSTRDALIAALNDFNDRFRGGPPTPRHPLPSDAAAPPRRRPGKLAN
jgi:hypothetical protein